MKMLHLAGEQTQYNCKICTFQSKYPNSLKIHVKNVHQRKGDHKLLNTSPL